MHKCMKNKDNKLYFTVLKIMKKIILFIIFSSTIFENLEWQQDLIIGLPILIIGAVLVINQKIKPIK